MVYSQLGRRTQCTVLKKSIQTVELRHSEARRHVFFLLQIFTVDLLWGFCFVIWNHTLWFFKFLLFSPRNTKWLKQRTFRIWKIPLFPQELWKTSPRIFSPSWSPTAPKRGTLTGFSKVGNKKKSFHVIGACCSVLFLLPDDVFVSLLNQQRVEVTSWSFMIWPLCVRKPRRRSTRIPSLFL